MLSILFRDHLVFFPFFIFLIKGCEENLPVTIGVLERQLCLTLCRFMSPIPTVGSFLVAALTVPPALWIGDASKHLWSSCSYRKCPQGGSNSSCPTLVPCATSAFRKDSFLDSELECKVPEQTPKGLCLIASSPWSFTHPLQTHAYLGLPTYLLRCPGGCTLRKEVWSGGLSTSTNRPGWSLGYFSRVWGQMVDHPFVVLGTLVQVRENQTVLS